jgi:CRP/FNR family transcriptional regulator
MNICGALDQRLQVDLFESGHRQEWARRQQLFSSDAPAGPIFKVTSGIVAVSKTLPNGARQIVRFVLPGDICGYLSEAGRYSFDGEAITEVVTCTFPRDRFDSFAATHDAAAGAVRNELSRVLSAAGRHMTVLGRMPTAARVARFLCTMKADLNARSAAPDQVTLPMARGDIADYLGMRLETVSRSFAKLRKLRLISVRAEEIVILDEAGLAAVAGSGAAL